MSRDYILESFSNPVELKIDYPRELNEQQLAAVTAPPGPALVIAGAGSGKTRTLTYRVAYLVEQGIPPERILLLTFTNKAAGEMMHRVTGLLGRELPSLWGGTFHSIGNRILRQHAPLLGLGRGFSILDREDAHALVKACVKDSGISTKDKKFPKPEVLLEIYSLAANTCRPVEEVIAERHEHFETQTGMIARLCLDYASRKLKCNSVDFDDLLTFWVKLLREHDEPREAMQRRFQFILVDEYQDTNPVQCALIDLLAARHHNIMAVGDDAQSIYAWRGANFRNIIEFPRRYPEARIYKIETNYRSTPEILTLANVVIAANTEQFSKNLAAVRKSGAKPALVACEDGRQQAAFVGQRIRELHESGTSLRDMAALYRSHFHALDLQMELTQRGIPFVITSGIRFFEQAHIKDITAWIKLVVNPREEASFRRLVMQLPGIGEKGADKLWATYAPMAGEGAVVSSILHGMAQAVPKKAAADWGQMVETMKQVEPVRHLPGEMIRMVIDAGYEDYLEQNYENYRNRLDDLTQLADFSTRFSGAEDFLAQLALLSEVEDEQERGRKKNEDAVRLSTVHQAKGLEFGVVFVIMVNDGMFPLGRCCETIGGEEEERRLFYVAVTRARNELYLSHVRERRTSTGWSEPVMPSRFLNDVSEELVENWNLVRGW
jgi:DNA helicase-2/ATP-dependent DNA helicase PcrA